MNKTIDELVNRFLGWKLPKDFAPDGGIVFDKHQNHHFTPIGTNLFTADQAKQMFEYLLEGEPLTLDKIYTNNERHKGLVKRLLIQLEIDIELDKAMQLCNAFHDELSQGEPVGYYYAQRNANGVIAQVLTPNKPNKKFVEYGNIFDVQELFTAPPSTEALQKDKAEIIEYYKYIKNALICIYDAKYSGQNKNIISTVDMANLAKEVLDIPKPKCME